MIILIYCSFGVKQESLTNSPKTLLISKIIFSSSDPRGHVGYSHHFAFIIVVIVVVISFSHFIQLIWNYRTILKQIWLNSSWVVSFQNCVQHFWNQNNNSCDMEHIICIPILVNIVEDSNLLFFLKKIIQTTILFWNTESNSCDTEQLNIWRLTCMQFFHLNFSKIIFCLKYYNIFIVPFTVSEIWGGQKEPIMLPIQGQDSMYICAGKYANSISNAFQ